MKQYLRDTLLYLLFIMLALVNYGWHYGWHNHAALIPAIYHIMDPSVLANDLHAGDFPVYIRALTWLIAQMGKGIPLPLLFFIFQVLSLFLLIYAIRKLTEEILPGEPLFGWFTVFVVIVYHFIPGENLIIGSWILFGYTFYMYTLGYAVWLLALVYFAKRKIIWAAILAGLALYIHFNHGELIVLMLVGIILLSRDPLKEKVRNLVIFGLVSSIIGAPILIPAIKEQILSTGQAAVAGGADPSFYDVIRFRHRHHIQPTAWPVINHVMFVIQIIITAYFFKLRRKISWTNIDSVLFRAFIVVIFLCAIGYLNEALRIEVIDKSYLFRTSVISAVITLAYACWLFWVFVVRKIKRDTVERYARYAFTALWIYAIAAFYVNYKYPELFERWPRIFHGITFNIQQTPLEEYIEKNTPKDTIFLVSPEYIRFSTNTRRAQVVNWMAIPFNKDKYKDWYERIVDLTGGEVTIESTRNIKDSYAIRSATGPAFYSMPLDKLCEVAKKYNAEYCVFKNTLPIEPEFQWEDMALYKLQ